MLALTLLSLSCRQESTRSLPPEPSPPPPVDFFEPNDWPAPYADSSLWKRAALGDPIDRARLAEQHSPGTLIPVVLLGGVVGRTALKTLPHLADPYPALLPLCEALPRATRTSLLLLLQAQLTLLQRGPSEESLDPAAFQGCESELTVLESTLLKGEGDSRAEIVDLIAAVRAAGRDQAPSGPIAN